MSRSLRRGFLWVGLTAAVVGLVILTIPTTARAEEPKVRLEVPSGAIEPGDPPFTVDVAVEDVTNLGAFEFDLRYDSSVLDFVDVQGGPFLGSSGREVRCLDPNLAPGAVRLVCVTLGALPAGPDGSGVLASVTLAPTRAGASQLQLNAAILARPDGQRIASTVESSSLTVGSPGQAGTPLPVASASVDGTPTEAISVQPTAGQTTEGTSNDSGPGWALWGPLIGGAAILVTAGAAGAWWSRTRKQT